MKKIIVLSVLLLFSSTVLASEYIGSDNPNCDFLGYDSVVKYDSPSDGYSDGILLTWYIDDEGETNAADWQSDDDREYYIIEKSGRDSYLHVPGTDHGVIETSNDHAISHIEFCVDEEDEEPPQHNVPEFGVLAGLGILALTGIYMHYKRP